MSPEQAQGHRLDARSDLFSLGAVLYELLTGKKAFPGRDLPTVLLRVASEDPTAPSTLNAGLPPAVDAVVARALAKDPALRYPSGRTFAEDIEDLLADRAPRNLASWTMPKPPKTMVSRPAPPPPLPPEPEAPVAGAGTLRGGTGRGSGLLLPPGKRVSLAFLSGPRQGEVFLLSRPTASSVAAEAEPGRTSSWATLRSHERTPWSSATGGRLVTSAAQGRSWMPTGSRA
jgi:serine/threonine protein kinase